MATIKEDCVSFETAKLLKEKGFDESTICRYAGEGGITEKWYDYYRERVLRFDWEEGYLIKPPREPKDQYEIIGNTISAPTLQIAMKWLREVHNLHIMINCIGKVNYDPIVQRFDGEDFEVEGVKVGTIRLIGGKWVNVRHGFETYEQAASAAIKYCLENLIK